MSRGAIVLIPAFFAIWYISRRTLTEAFLYVYMTAVLALPSWGRWVLPGLPDPSFDEAAILPIMAVFLWRSIRSWKYSYLDSLILLLLLAMGISEYINAGYADAQNMMFDLLAAGLFPYMLAKQLINTNTLRVRFAKRFVWSLLIVFLTTLYEFKFANNPYRMLFDHFFPGQGGGWVVTFRFGLPRVSGPFGHPILNGIVTIIGLQFAFWLRDGNLWNRHFRWPVVRWNKGITLVAAMILELLITFTRGPQIAAVFAWSTTWMGWGKDPLRRSRAMLMVLFLLGVPAALWFNSYASIGRARALTLAQQTAAYRKELVDKYIDIVIARPWLGWGTSGWPKVSGMPSIDNHYLLLSLMHGLLSSGLFVTILLYTMIRLLRNGMKNAPVSSPVASLSFALLGTYVGLAFSLATVYMGLNVIPIFFMLTGFAEGYLMAGGDDTLQVPGHVPAHLEKPFQFRRVVA